MVRSQNGPRRRLNFPLTSGSGFGSVQSADLKKQLDTMVALTLKTTGDMANLQLYEAASESLRIVSHFGVPQEFVSFFSSTHAGQAACGTAMKRRRRVVIEDVATHRYSREPRQGT
jgi:putative methionine-R-sulfoxide reductase with GAF domain